MVTIDERARSPLWLKVAYAIGVPVIVAVYWPFYGPQNFLWLSDVALFCTAIAVLADNRLFASMPAAGVLPLEVAWAVDFVCGGKLMGLASYMFDPSLGWWLRGLSLFHLALPPTLIYIVWRDGYDRRALVWQALLTVAVLLLTYYLTDPGENINWVFGPNGQPQHDTASHIYLMKVMAVILIGVLLPMHYLLQWLFGDERRAAREFQAAGN
ncbi:MAG: membrane-associated protein [Alphaproteobacteria bacterium]|nr:membrane-associated protein [Alphaproteobacteria bacterium]